MTTTATASHTGTFDIGEGKATFRFYSELGNWDKNSIGSRTDDNPLEVTMTDGNYAGACVSGKGSWKFTDWTGGKMKMVVDTNNMTVDFSTVE